MHISHVTVISLAVGFLGVTGFWSGSAGATGFDFFKERDQSVCYNLIDGRGVPTKGFIRINVEEHSRLTTFKEKSRHGHPLQTTYSALGFLASPDPSTPYASVDGMVNVAKGEGARMGLDLISQLRTVRQTAQWECASGESSLTPDKWNICREQIILNFGDIIDGEPFSLQRVNPLDYPECSRFILPPF